MRLSQLTEAVLLENLTREPLPDNQQETLLDDDYLSIINGKEIFWHYVRKYPGGDYRYGHIVRNREEADIIMLADCYTDEDGYRYIIQLDK